MIDPAGIYELGLSGDAFEPETKPGDDPQAPVIVGSCCAADSVQAHTAETEVDAGAGRLRHEPLAAGLSAQPVTQVAVLVRVNAVVQAHDAEQFFAGVAAYAEA